MNDDGQPIVHIMPDKGFVNFEDPIPLYVSGFGPRSLDSPGSTATARSSARRPPVPSGVPGT